MNTKIHVSHVSLYVLYLLQTVATFLAFLIWQGSDIAMNFFCPSSLLVMLADTGVSLLQWILLVLWFLLRRREKLRREREASTNDKKSQV